MTTTPLARRAQQASATSSGSTTLGACGAGRARLSPRGQQRALPQRHLPHLGLAIACRGHAHAQHQRSVRPQASPAQRRRTGIATLTDQQDPPHTFLINAMEIVLDGAGQRQRAMRVQRSLYLLSQHRLLHGRRAHCAPAVPV